jgi:hypothetical protein
MGMEMMKTSESCLLAGGVRLVSLGCVCLDRRGRGRPVVVVVVVVSS